MAKHVCPLWVGHLLAHPLRKLIHPPKRLLSPYVKPNMTVVDLGCAMGFFSIPMAEMVGPAGRVICLDIQKNMLEHLMHRARKANMADRIEARLCAHHTLGLADVAGHINFVLASAVIHELSDPDKIFNELYGALYKDGIILVVEPKAHVTAKAFQKTLQQARSAGFQIEEKKRHCATLIKPEYSFV